MKGTRPLTDDEITRVADCFTGTYETRNRNLFLLGISTGGRISELLSLRVKNVWQNGKPVGDLHFDKAIVKGGEVSRAVPLNTDGRQAIEALITWQVRAYGDIDSASPLFISRKRSEDGKHQPMRRGNADKMLRKAFADAGLNGNLATHSMRKSFAQRLYNQTGDIYVIQEMLGHKSVGTTQAYLGVNYTAVRDALESMNLMSAVPETTELPPLDDLTDTYLIAELEKRGYLVSKVS